MGGAGRWATADPNSNTSQAFPREDRKVVSDESYMHSKNPEKYSVNEAAWCTPGMTRFQKFGKVHRGSDTSGAQIDRESQTRTTSLKYPKSMGATVVVIVVAICIAQCLWLFTKTSALPSSHRHYPARVLASLELEEPCDVGLAEVIGLEFCPELEPMVPTFMEIKKSLLRLGIDAAADAGESPLMLIHLIKKRADLLFSPTSLGEGMDGWLKEQKLARENIEAENLLHNTSTEFRPELFLNRIDEFYLEDLGRSRPVVVYVNGPDMCTFWDELTAHAGLKPASAEDPDLQMSLEPKVEVTSTVVGGKTPLVLMTLGWDRNGSPFYYLYRECSMKVLGLPEVVRWVVSHSNGDSPSPKVKFVPIGFGGGSTKSGLPQSQMVDYSKEKLRCLESCTGEKMEMLFMCNNNSSNTPRAAINDALNDFNSTDEAARVVPNNHFPMDPADMISTSTNGIFAISPPGTRPDCFRHYEFLLAGNIVYVPDDPSLRLILSGLPVVFVQGHKADGWSYITCDAMAEHARHVQQRLQDGMRQETVPAFNYAKLMLPYWSRFVRDVVWEAAEELRQPLNGTLREDYLSAEDYPAEMTVGPK